MRLTKEMRRVFVRRVIDDVPQIDYLELARDRAQACILEKTTVEPVRQLLQDPGLHGYLNDTYIHVPHIGMIFLYGIESGNEEFKKMIVDELADLSRACLAQRTRIEELSQRLEAVAASATTTKRLAELLPEFAKYLPEDEQDTKNLPALPNLVADLIKAGWPKGSKP